MAKHFLTALSKLPLIAILRGLTTAEAAAALEALLGAGFVMIEVPLNSPEPFATLAAMRRLAPAEVLIGAGTVLTKEQVSQVAEAGGDLVVSPNLDVDVVAATKRLGLISLPGVATPSEAFAALKAGADGLKAFPAEAIGPTIVKAWRAVIPADVPIVPVGGITPDAMASFVKAGASGFGLGSALYKPDVNAARLAERARAFVDAWRALRA
jgi:2-dehydro-3-deoxyphosphogalactonate aldolase